MLDPFDNLSEGELREHAQGLFLHPHFRILPMLLLHLELKILRDGKQPGVDPGETILFLRVLEEIRNTIRAFAATYEVNHDPFERYEL